jgi:hypothetical protein
VKLENGSLPPSDVTCAHWVRTARSEMHIGMILPDAEHKLRVLRSGVDERIACWAGSAHGIADLPAAGPAEGVLIMHLR